MLIKADTRNFSDIECDALVIGIFEDEKATAGGIG
jgi:hypothetical protein